MQTEVIHAQDLIPIVAIIGGICVAIIAILAGTIRSTARTKEVEATRREVAAYVAEGSMTADDAERILSAGAADSGSSCCSKQA